MKSVQQKPVRNPQFRDESGVVVIDDEIVDNLLAEIIAQSYITETVTNTKHLLIIHTESQFSP